MRLVWPCSDGISLSAQCWIYFVSSDKTLVCKKQYNQRKEFLAGSISQIFGSSDRMWITGSLRGAGVKRHRLKFQFEPKFLKQRKELYDEIYLFISDKKKN